MAPTAQPPAEIFCMNCGPGRRSSVGPIADHQRFAAWRRAHIRPCYDTSLFSAGQAADRIATWIRHHLTEAGANSPAAN